jgi:hypothetical protein
LMRASLSAIPTTGECAHEPESFGQRVIQFRGALTELPEEKQQMLMRHTDNLQT